MASRLPGINKRRLFTAAGWVLGGAAALWTAYYYQDQKRRAIERIRAGGRTVDTPHGPIEYAAVGQGPAVLVLHGGGAGYDNGLVFTLPEHGFRFIVPSRPGYLNTPIETGRTFEEQADAFAALLDALEIPQAVIFGMSGGGPPALQFALRYPERCWGLVLLSAACQPLPPFPPFMQFVLRVMGRSDFLPWLIMRAPVAMLLSGSKLYAPVAGNAEKERMLRGLLDTMFPLSYRLPGVLNDLEQATALQPYPLEKISIPTLVIHGDSDSIVPFSNGQLCAQTIPSAQFLVIEDGDHLCFLTHLERIRPVLIDFLTRHTPRGDRAP